ncbi:MAG: VCBS repeat-containing protein [Deltaproteobacteria bacterium]|nr:VCBS repeat-containing protein [Deltaproteobacteria bacterium]
MGIARALRVAAAILAGMAAFAPPVGAARQSVALFPPDVIPASDNALFPAVGILDQAIQEKLADRFDIRTSGAPSAPFDESVRRRKARSLGASHAVTGSLSRIGKTVTLDITLAPVEEPGKGRTVVVSGTLDNTSPLSPQYAPLFRRLGAEAALKIKYLFFGDERVGEGPTAKRVPKIAGSVSRGAPVPGDIASVAISDTDRDGRMELVAAYPDQIAVYAIEGDELREEAKIPGAGPGLFHVEAADVDRNGVAEIVATRYSNGKASSDVWRYDGKEYKKTSSDLPYFLRVADLGTEGIVLLAQSADSAKVYGGPVFRLAVDRNGVVKTEEKGPSLPLPDGVFLYAFTPLRFGKKEVRYAVLTARDRIVYLDSAGKELGEGLDAVTVAEVVLDGKNRKVQAPGHMAAVDLNADGTEELVILNDVPAAGTFFENLRVHTHAELLCFAQAGDVLQLAWRSPQWEASVNDLAVDRSKKDAPRFGVASRDRGKVIGGTARWQILWVK